MEYKGLKEYEIIGDVLYKNEPMEYKNFIRTIPLITKEAFIMCYKKWIREESEEKECCDIKNCDNRDATKVIERSLCDSCVNRECIFQSGIVRNHCDFYKGRK